MVALIYDGNSKPRLGSRWTWKVLERKLTWEPPPSWKGVLRQDVMARVLEYAAENREVLAEIWAEFHDGCERDEARARSNCVRTH